jgi:hypothetical protein
VDGLTLGLGALAWLATYLWVFASLAAVQLTVRLILRFDVRETAMAALWLSAAVIVAGVLLLQLSNGAIDPAVVERLRQQGDAAGVGGRLAQTYVAQQRLSTMPLAVAALVGAGWLVARHVLHMRPRSALVSALALGLIIAPWPLLVLV